MYTKKLTYTDYNGETRTETLYFNLTKAEITEMELMHPGGYSEYLQKIIDAKDQEQLVNVFKTLLLKAYGEKSDDGRHFRKSEKITSDFESTQAYSEMFVLLVTNTEESIAFVNGIMPFADVPESEREAIAEKTRALIDSKKNAE